MTPLENIDMKTPKLGLMAFVAGVLGTTMAAADFDGSEPLMCSFGNVIECDHGSTCRAVTNESVDAPDFVKLDFRKKELVSTTAGEDSGAEDITVTDFTSFLVVQGAQGSGPGGGNTLGWSISIDQASGQMVAAGAGEHAGFVIFGACAPN